MTKLTCLECNKSGFSALNHAHWRTKCTGNIKCAADYRKKFPGAETATKETRLKYSNSLKTTIDKYGLEEGTRRWDKYCNQHSFKNTLEGYLQKGKTKEDWLAYNKAKSATLENFQRRYGADGQKRWDEYCETQSTNGCKLEWFIEKHGYDKGLLIYQELNKKKGITPENMIRKWGFDEGMVRWHAWLESTNGNSISKLQKEIVIKIVDLLSTDHVFHDGIYSKEFVINDQYESKIFMYDFVITYPIKICIEVNGDFYHANPNFYKATDRLRHRGSGVHGKLAEDIWKYDLAKKNSIEQRGYKVYSIWESEWNHDQIAILEKVKTWLQP